jgi:hypothetical protein
MKTPSPVDDPAHWRQRAQEARRMAEHSDEPDVKKGLMEIAAAYERLVALIEQLSSNRS